ncbi:gluconokinase [Brevibacterium atlanticum]|uniref:gluconokinase n=1 Tax=Brevibacterium atlanticum TaxID=2697563 RepID=UPI00141DF29F|nr:gluconokinase [Brevibacterium atlanticum]
MGQRPSSSPLVIMGVSGTGKTVLGAQVAQALDRRFVDADDLHSAANKAKMASGTPLDDDDRAPWLAAVAAEAGRTPAPVIACSALKRSYRDLLRRAAPGLVFIHLDGPREVIAGHLARRDHEFMSPDLLDSQLATLEPLTGDEAHSVVDVDQTIPAVLDAILVELKRLNHTGTVDYHTGPIGNTDRL